MFHHDGPFDALDPRRNRQGSRRAPMQAFPKDSLNNVLGGSGPLNARPDHATFMGNADEEAFKDYASGAGKKDGYYPPSSSKADIGVFDPLSRGSILHGDQTLGLGTSTFLEGTPAARTAIQRRDAETAQDNLDGGLARKKSLAQRIRSINRGPRDYPAGRLTNPEGVYASRKSPTDLTSPTTSSSMQTPRGGERNPFFNEFDAGGTIAEEENISVVRRTDNPKSPTSPKPLERRATTDATSPDDAQPKPGGSGLLARVKSLKSGTRRAAPPRPTEQQPAAGGGGGQAQPAAEPAPGTAA